MATKSVERQTLFTIQYIPRKMHTVFTLRCFVVVIHWLIFPYPSGLLHWYCGNLTIAPVPAKQPWWIWINTSCEFIMNDCIITTKQSTTKPCAYFLGYTVCLIKYAHDWALLHGDVIKWKHFPRYWPFFAGNSPVPGEFPTQRPVTRSFDVFFDLRLNKPVCKTIVRLVIWDASAFIMTSL